MVDQTWGILNLYELLGWTFARSREIALKMAILGKFTDGTVFFVAVVAIIR